MFSVMYTGMNLLPLCTASVCPTNSGETVDARAQVLMTRFSPRLFISRTFSSSFASMYGPFFTDRAIASVPGQSSGRCLAAPPATHDVLARRLLPLARLLALRLPPRRHRRAPPRRPALTAAQRVIDRVHRHAPHLRPPAAPTVRPGLADLHELVVHVAHLADGRQALLADHPHLGGREPQRDEIAFLRHDLRAGSRRPHHLRALARLELHVVHHGPERDLSQRQSVAVPDIRARPAHHDVALPEPHGVQDVALLPIGVVQQRDVRRPVRVVLDLRHAGRHPELVALEIDAPVQPLGPAPTPPGRDPTMVVPPTRLAQRLRQRLLRPLARDLVERAHGAEAGPGRHWLELLDAHVRPPRTRRCARLPPA